MNTVNENQAKTKKEGRSSRAHVSDKAAELLNESKKYAGELYEEGMNGVHDAEETIKQYSDELLRKVQKNPLASIAIAAGVGFLLSSLLRK
ncbi:DUF883 family protein [Legionella sp. CNM-4043-24]|uniref:DUF883 family protein n=1 Tax=Legionella sp. CNM-4043-24 TaxID=3421646 RepID=UPI00403AA613